MNARSVVPVMIGMLIGQLARMAKPSLVELGRSISR